MKTTITLDVEIQTYGAYCDGRYDTVCQFLSGNIKRMWYCDLFGEVLLLSDKVTQIIRCRRCEKAAGG